MNTLLRWGKFNLVGAIGMGLQLALLALFNHWTAGHYLYASAAAIEFTLLHNFMWHLHYTWRDRRNGATRLRQFARFHLSNGVVSMLGNLALMQLLVHKARLSTTACSSKRAFARVLHTRSSGPSSTPGSISAKSSSASARAAARSGFRPAITPSSTSMANHIRSSSSPPTSPLRSNCARKRR